MRLNCSHGDQSFFESKVACLREYLDNRPNRDSLDPSTGIAVNARYLKGPEIRTGRLSAFDDRQVSLSAGEHVVLTTDRALAETGANHVIPQIFVDYPGIAGVVGVGSEVYVDDGLIRLEVVAMTDTALECRAVNSGVVAERKGVNLPGAILDLPAVSSKDVEDIKLAAKVGADFIFASFVRKGEHVRAVREILRGLGRPEIKIISKIENQEGLDNFGDILEASDGIMVARGDLGIEIPHKVVTAQKQLINACNAAGKPVVCATQMLESMVSNPRATRAEVSDVANAVLDGADCDQGGGLDVANAVLDGADCVMLSGETAKGRYPVEAILTMGQICREADNLVEYDQVHARRAPLMFPHSMHESICAAAVRCAMDEKAALIVVFTTSGLAPQFVSKYRPPMPVLAATADPVIARQSYMLRGITPLLLEDMAHGHLLCNMDECPLEDLPNMVLEGAVEYAKRIGICEPGDSVV
eukprot:CAMPEP_0177589708 /NCGR_PEP_ID=MMETSP0419_2-20121207/6969_1 /TAXON_ID=582737 /ORGANISM="Tetraselmis sp., Strain GSL018" /LENGTH=471 /DNA_ID=CAMNT_0019080123 /DNA_START=353 /DNA_END=1766 /DNA_ORIENTATION=-